jgi:hypothetical protein
MTISGRVGSAVLLVMCSGCCTLPPDQPVTTPPAAPQPAVEPAGTAQQPPESSVTAPPAPATTPALADAPSSAPTTPQATAKPSQSAPPTPEPAAAASGSRAPAPPTVAKPALPDPKALARPVTPASKPAAPAAPAAAAPVAKPPAAIAPLDLTTLKQELTGTKAIGFFSKLTLKNQMDDLLDRFREFHQGKTTITAADLRRSYDLLIMKVLSMVQDDDKKLASDIVSSREALWGVLVDPVKFAKLDV